MYKAKFYHGLSAKEWRLIKNKGQFNIRKDTGRWLAMRGVYFFRDNPVLAYRWAFRKEFAAQPLPHNPENPSPSKIKPVVIQVELDEKKIKKRLDLTTDFGMQLLFMGHRRLRGILDDNFRDIIRAIRKAPPSDIDYYTTLINQQSTFSLSIFGIDPKIFENIIKQLSTEFVKNKMNDFHYVISSILMAVSNGGYDDDFNFDCAAITLLVLKYKYQLIVAAVQEGQSLNERFHEHTFRNMFTDGYAGIRVQDHIEICVTDPEIIKWPPIKVSISPKKYDPDFWNAANETRGNKLRT